MIHFILERKSRRSSTMLEVKEAVKKAKGYLPDLFFESGHQIADLRLEEVELSDDDKYWAVTFSYLRTDNPGPVSFREYKTIRIRTEHGEFVGVRNGMLASNAA
jgi:hypothetical protein